MRESMFLVLLLVVGCTKTLPIEGPSEPARPRPQWANNLAAQTDALHACLGVREAPGYVVFLEPLPSGATGITTVDAYGAIEHCAYWEGRIVRREPADFSVRDVGAAQQAVFSPGATQPIVPVGEVIEEVLEHGQVVGWLYWPRYEASKVAEGEPGVEP